jgi:hypothetical protein
MYKFFYFKIAIKAKVDSYMPCEAMAHSTKSNHVERQAIIFSISGQGIGPRWGGGNST